MSGIVPGGVPLGQTGLVIRPALPDDVDALAAFTADVLRHQDAAEPDRRTGAWTRDLLAGGHPYVGYADFTVVEEPRTRRIVSSAGLISQTWTYAGLPFSVGQPELIGTDVAYRGRGLVRAQMDVLHRMSVARGQRLLAIDGVPWFYRQFGYEMALELRGEISIDATRISLPAGENAGAFRVRTARPEDIAGLSRVYARAQERSLVACQRDPATWLFELGRDEDSFYRLELRVIESAAHGPCGYFAHEPLLHAGTLSVVQYEIEGESSWSEITPVVLSDLCATGRTYAERSGDADLKRIGLCLGSQHPVYGLVGELSPRDEGAYAWYLRVPDLPAFVQYVAPALEARLAGTDLAGYSGRVLLSFYRSGLRFDFDRGRLASVSAWRPRLDLPGVERNVPTAAERAAAAFPNLTFLQLLFGYRSLDELRHAFADCIVRTSDAHQLLTALFPKRPSNVWAMM